MAIIKVTDMEFNFDFIHSYFHRIENFNPQFPAFIEVVPHVIIFDAKEKPYVYREIEVKFDWTKGKPITITKQSTAHLFRNKASDSTVLISPPYSINILFSALTGD